MCIGGGGGIMCDGEDAGAHYVCWVTCVGGYEGGPTCMCGGGIMEGVSLGE